MQRRMNLNKKKEIVNKVLHMVKINALELARQCKIVYETIMMQKNTVIAQISGTKALNQNEISKD